MREDEARTKKCPQGQSFSMSDGKVTIGGFCDCIASDCMMWTDDKDNTDNCGCGLNHGYFYMAIGKMFEPLGGKP